MSLAPEISLDSVVKSIFRRKLFFVAVTVLGLAMTVAVFVLMEKKYTSEARLFVQLGRSSVGLDPTATASTTISVMDSRETEIRSIVDLIASRGVAEEVVRQVGAEPILKSKYDFIQLPGISQLLGADDKNEPSELAMQYAEGRTADQQRDFEAAVKAFSEDMLAVKAEKKTSVISVYCKANSPELAKTLADKVLEVTRELHLKISYVEGSNPFFEDEFLRTTEELASLEAQMESFLSERKILSIEAQRSLSQSLMDQLVKDIMSTEAILMSLEQAEKVLNQEIESTPEMLDLPNTGLEDSVSAGAGQKLIELKAQLATLRSRYREDHHLVQEALMLVQETEAEVGKRDDSRTERHQQRNPLYEDLRQRLSVNQANQAAERSKLGYLRNKFDAEEAKLVGMNRDQREVEQLRRNINIANAAVLDFEKKRRESEILAKLNEQQISNLEVASPGSYVTKQVFPKASLIFPLGAAGSLAMATFLSLLTDRRQGGGVSTMEVERNVGVPVLVSLPRVRATVRQ